MVFHAIFTMLVFVTAFAALINDRYFRLPRVVALTFFSVSLSGVITYLLHLSPEFIAPVHKLLSSVDFKVAFLDVMLGYLLFAGAIRINSVALKKNLPLIIYFASIGVVISTVIIGFTLWYLCLMMNINLSLADCLIFGALISPTDPIAVGSVFQTTSRVPENLKSCILGESLFNDATGILLLVVLLRVFYLNHDESGFMMHTIKMVVLQESLGGLIWGWVIGKLTSVALVKTNDHEVSILVTLAAVSSGYVVANYIHVSQPIAMIIAGLVVGGYIKSEKFSLAITNAINDFWAIIDDLFNAFLFVLIGLELLTIDIGLGGILFGVCAIAIILLARLFIVLIPKMLHMIPRYHNNIFAGHNVWLFCIGGIRGGISVALALGMPNIPNLVVAATYVVVLFSILVQSSVFRYTVSRSLRH